VFAQGQLYEAQNLAALWNLPLILLIENNHVSLSFFYSLLIFFLEWYCHVEVARVGWKLGESACAHKTTLGNY